MLAARARLLAASVLMAVLPASLAAAAPVISGADGDSWNASETPARYVITGDSPGAIVSWQLQDGEDVVPGFSGAGASPLTVTLTGAPDGTFALVAAQAFSTDPGRSARALSIDTVAPAITIARPANGAGYVRGERVTADYSCADASTCTGPVPAGSPFDTAGLGARTFAVSAADAAGNTSQASAGYTISTGPPPPIQTLTIPPPRVGGPGLPVTNPTRLRPAMGTALSVRNPVLGWTRVGSARLYNLQVFRVQGSTAVKVLSVFPTGTLYRVPPGRLTWGARYVWRVWPLVKRSYTRSPHGQSWFAVRRPLDVTPAQLLVNQRISQAALRRIDAISRWLDAGLVTGDLRDGGLGREDFSADVALTGSGAAIGNGVASPRPVRPAAPPKARPSRLRVTPGQMLVNQRISQAAVRRANALERRIDGGLTGGDIRGGAVVATKLAPGLLVTSAQPRGSGPAASRTVVARVARRAGGRVELGAGQVLVNQRISQAAVRRANTLIDQIEGGLTGANFRDGAISAVSIAPVLR